MFNRVILLALLVSAMSPISSIAADIKPADKRNYELQQQISYNVIIPPEAFETSADGTLIVPIEIKTDDKGNIVAVEAGPNNWKLDREAYLSLRRLLKKRLGILNMLILMKRLL